MLQTIPRGCLVHWSVCVYKYIYIYIYIYTYISACVFTHIRVYEMKNEDVDTSSYQEEWWFEKKEPRGHK